MLMSNVNSPAIIVDSFVRKGKMLPHLKCRDLFYHHVLLLKSCTSLSSQEWFNWSMARGHTTSFTNFVPVLLQFLKVGLWFLIIPHNFLKVEFPFWLILVLSTSIIVTPMWQKWLYKLCHCSIVLSALSIVGYFTGSVEYGSLSFPDCFSLLASSVKFSDDQQPATVPFNIWNLLKCCSYSFITLMTRFLFIFYIYFIKLQPATVPAQYSNLLIIYLNALVENLFSHAWN